MDGPDCNIQISDYFNGEKEGQDLGINIISIEGGIGKVGYYDSKGLWQAKYELECVHAEGDLGVSTKYVGASLQGTCVTIEGKTRILQLFGKKIYVGGSLDILSVGAKCGFDVKENKIEIGVSLGVGVGFNISWEDVKELECDSD